MIIKIANKEIQRNRTITDIFPVDIPPAPIALPATDETLFSFYSNWYSTVPVTGFYLDIANDSGFTSFLPGFNNLQISGDVSTYFVPDLSCGEDYFYRIRSYYIPTHSSPNSNVITAYTLSIDAPVLLAETDVSYNTFTMNWQEVLNVSEYHVDVADNSTFIFPIYNDINVGTSLSYIVNDLSSYTTYYYRVRSYTNECISNNSNIGSVMTLGYLIEPPVATAATDVSYNNFDANWLASTGATGYHLFVALDASFTSYVPGFNNLDVGNTLIYPISGLSENTTYYYRLNAYNSYMTTGYSNIIDVTTPIPIFSACANFSPHYASTPPTTGFLDVDAIISNVANVSTYLIEWHLNSSIGTTVFISGVGSDPSIQAQHPFPNPEVVFAGTLYPVIKYMYFDNIRYTSYYEVGSHFSPDLIDCLDPVIVNPVTCSTVLGADQLYPYYLSYVNERDIAADKSRTIKFNLSPSTNYLAWEFQAYDVAEQLKLYYCTSTNATGTLLDNFILGTRNSTGGGLTTNLYPVNYPTNPRTYNYSRSYGTKYVTNLTGYTYSPDNYIKIEIIGSVLEPTVINTNWNIKLKCFSNSDISCWFYDSSISKLDTTTDPSIGLYTSAYICYYDMTYYTQKDASNLVKYSTSLYNPWLWKYTQMNVLDSGTNPASRSMTDPIHQGLYWFSQTYTQWIWTGTPRSPYVCQNLNSNQTITVTRTTDPSTVVFTFTDASDYNVFVSDVQSIQSSPDYIKWQSTPDTSIEYYGVYYMYWNDASSCGDTQSINSMSFHLNSSISHDDLNKTLTITPYVPTISSFINDMSTLNCDQTYTFVSSVVQQTRTVATGSSAYHYTKVRMQNPVCSYTYTNRNSHEISRESYYAFYIDDAMLNGVCDLSKYGFIYDVSTLYYNYYNFMKRWTLFRWWDKFSLTGDASTHEDRLNNWKLERKILLRTDSSIDTGYETVYNCIDGSIVKYF
jgi:hypothetical protein